MNVKHNTSPDIAAFAAAISTKIEFAQVQILRIPGGFELRHAADAQLTEDALKIVAPADLRRLTQFAGNGAFRPLKSAPNLRAGWRTIVPGEEALERALAHLYPGAVADWFALRNGDGIGGSPKITTYREFSERQTGMYRITTKLDDAAVEGVIRSCCGKDFCLKRRLWTVNGSSPPPDALEEKSLIPCLEPCAILLESARKTARLELDAARPPVALPEISE